MKVLDKYPRHVKTILVRESPCITIGGCVHPSIYPLVPQAVDLSLFHEDFGNGRNSHVCVCLCVYRGRIVVPPGCLFTKQKKRIELAFCSNWSVLHYFLRTAL